jgi:dethiobiotin synthetase
VNIKLGCINHTLLSIEAIQRRSLKVHGWISNMCQPATEFSHENITSIEKMLHLNHGVNMIGQILYLENISKDGIYSDEMFKQFLI